jgi:NADH dehydrogenase [ubiquinone] 1 alpha subcomplex assembly factor 1
MLTSLFRLQIPFDNFVRTNMGEMSINQMKMFREKVKSVGISILGGNSGVEGKYELGIDSIRVVNEDDVVHSPKK